MKKAQLLNSALSHAIARLGHGDMIVIADAACRSPKGRRASTWPSRAAFPR